MNLMQRVINHVINMTILRVFFLFYLITGFDNKKASDETVAFTLFGRKEFVMGFISTVMFQRNSGVLCKVLVINDGTLTSFHEWCLSRVGVYTTNSQDRIKVENAIKNLPNTYKLYKEFILMKKLVDLHVLSEGHACLIYFDSDVLFMRDCHSFSDYVARCKDHQGPMIYFNKDISHSFVTNHEEIEKEFGLENIKCLNAGLFVCNQGVVKLELVEEILSNENFQMWTENRYWVTEQTIYAILASQSNISCKLLPNNFDLQIPPNLENETIHFVGAIRKHYWRGLLC